MPRTLPACLLVLACAHLAPAAGPPPTVDYLRDVKPLLRERCFACHGSLQQKAGLRLDTAVLVRQGGDSGPAVDVAHVEESLLLDRVRTTKTGRQMPPDGPPLTAAQIDTLRNWVARGAMGPADERPEADPRGHWAFRPLTRPAVPAGDAANPIDRFLKVTAPPADRRTLARRVYIDLTGLPPTREEMQAFFDDPSPLAYERLVDRLLASPAYGERWGRHWMDVWRYSDWYGRRSVPDVLNSYGMIWRWRDWIVRSLNEDRPYDRMVQEMLAADELCPTEPENVVATGFLARNFFRWNYNQWMRDNVEHTGKAFLGLTVQCAQCHDHKYDPITQKEYFALRAVFEPLEMRHDRVPGEPDPGVYPKYSYGASYGPITSGMIRVFDEKPDAQTFMYSRGDERQVIPGKPPVAPGALGFLGGDRMKVTPVELPAEAAYPGLLAFVRREEEEKVQGALRQKQAAYQAALGATPRAAVAVRLAELAAAEADADALRARFAADDARFGKTTGDKEALARRAARAEKVAAYRAALAKLVQQEQDLAGYTIDGPTAQVAPTEKLVGTLRKAADDARAAIAKAGNSYTPLGPTYGTRSSGRRLALAKWITSSDNPLTPRVAANHVWGWHFGEPLVESTANFGRAGSTPTHPALLDFLACELRDGGWRFKRLHRLIVTSQAYRAATFAPRRLEAEVVRDAMLHVAGLLDRAAGGPEVAQERGNDVPRRSLYFAHHGETRMAMLDLFDAANPNDCYRRAVSVRPQQALAMVNNEFTLRLARHLAGRLPNESDNRFLAAAFEQVLSRPPTPDEAAATRAFLARQQALFRASLPTIDPVARSRENIVHALFSHTDFVTLR